MDSLYTQVICSRCNRAPEKSLITGYAFVTYICYQNCGNVFWTQKQCPSCKVQNYTKIINKPKTGELITCKKCNFACYYFRCPYPKCKALMYKSKDLYCMGVSTACTSKKCQKLFKLLVCSCGGQIYFDPNETIYQGVSQYYCKQCQKNVIYATCPECQQLDYFFEKQEVGQKLKCSNCKQTRSFVPCPNCGKSINCKNFYYGQIQNCNHCAFIFQFVMCPNGCGINFYSGQQLNTPYRTCKRGCAKPCVVINCNKCKYPLFIDDYDFGFSREEQCPMCKSQIKFHLCQCGILNKNSNKCINNQCPVPQGVKNYSKQWKQQHKSKQNSNNVSNTQQAQSTEDYDAKICKVCFDLQSCMINESCRHMMMCQPCYKTMRNRPGVINDIIRCPICKQPGKYHLYKQPILQ